MVWAGASPMPGAHIRRAQLARPSALSAASTSNKEPSARPTHAIPGATGVRAVTAEVRAEEAEEGEREEEEEEEVEEEEDSKVVAPPH